MWIVPLANVVMPIAIPEVMEAEARGLVHVKIKRLVALHYILQFTITILLK